MANTVDTMCARNKHEDELHENALGSKRKNRQRVDALGFRLPLEGIVPRGQAGVQSPQPPYHDCDVAISRLRNDFIAVARQ